MIIGVGAVIALVAAGAGARAQVASNFESLGSNLLVVSPGSMSFGGVSQGSGSAASLTMDDVEAIEELASSAVALVAPQYTGSRATIVYGSNNTQISVIGITQEYFPVRNYELDRGRLINELDLVSRSKVAVLGPTVVEDLFGGALIDPIGKTIKINRESYEVVGITKEKGSSGFNNYDEVVLIPLTTAQIKFGGAGNDTISQISVSAVSQDKMERAQAEVKAIIRASHGLASTQSDDFSVQNQASIVQMVQSTSETFTVLLGSIAAISLVVGGIGIMNIMLVSVTERTREIGIRKAVGAKRRDLLTQFLIEAIVLSLAGGIIGILAGIGGAQVVSPMLGTDQPIVTSGSMLMALGVSVAIGLFFGIYPAARAAALHPIEALRYE
ncbi:MAG: ABC transporter permease, partial [Anaerolineae bacterium]|nr:ABC transporter permease [Anaerolineae bacterium]